MPVRVVDYEDGYQSQALAGVPRVELIPFVDGRALAVGADTVLVMQGIVPSTIRRELQPMPGTPVLFWTLHPLNWIPTLIPVSAGRGYQIRHPDVNRRMLKAVFPGYRSRLVAFLRDLDEAGALLFMDGTTLDFTTRSLGLHVPGPRMLPVPVETTGTRRRWTWGGSDDVIRIGSLGRLADFKMPTLLHLLERLNRWVESSATRVELHIIGDGPEAARLRASIRPHARMTFHFPGTLTGSELDDYLCARVDLLAAMGTSALQGARLGIPTILLDIAYAPLVGDHSFHWLFEAKRFTLGEIIPHRRSSRRDRGLEEMLASLKANYEELSDRTYGFCSSRHDIAVVAQDFIKSVDRTYFSWADIPGELYSKSVPRQVYERFRTIAAVKR